MTLGLCWRGAHEQKSKHPKGRKMSEAIVPVLRENIAPKEWERGGYQTRAPESRCVLPGRECFGNVPALCASLCIPVMCACNLLICSCLLLCPSGGFWGGAKGERRGFLKLNRGQAGRTWALGQEEETSPPQLRFPGWGLGRMPSGEGGWTMLD